MLLGTGQRRPWCGCKINLASRGRTPMPASGVTTWAMALGDHPREIRATVQTPQPHEAATGGSFPPRVRARPQPLHQRAPPPRAPRPTAGAPPLRSGSCAPLPRALASLKMSENLPPPARPPCRNSHTCLRFLRPPWPMLVRVHLRASDTFMIKKKNSRGHLSEHGGGGGERAQPRAPRTGRFAGLFPGGFQTATH